MTIHKIIESDFQIKIDTQNTDKSINIKIQDSVGKILEFVANPHEVCTYNWICNPLVTIESEGCYMIAILKQEDGYFKTLCINDPNRKLILNNVHNDITMYCQDMI